VNGRWREGVVKWREEKGVKKKKLKWKDNIYSKERGSMLTKKKKDRGYGWRGDGM
jgi:hypothetical protein